MSVHTEGPWTLREGDVYAGDLKVAEVWANAPVARLVAAAPELLACLKEAVAAMAEWDIGEPGDGDPLAHWRAVIAKAESEGR